MSSSDCASRIEPSPHRAMARNEASETLAPSCLAMSPSRFATASAGIRLKSNRCTRDRMVSMILSGSVVANRKITCGGGASNVFSNALNAALDSMWTSSMR